MTVKRFLVILISLNYDSYFKGFLLHYTNLFCSFVVLFKSALEKSNTIMCKQFTVITIIIINNIIIVLLL